MNKKIEYVLILLGNTIKTMSVEDSKPIQYKVKWNHIAEKYEDDLNTISDYEIKKRGVRCGCSGGHVFKGKSYFKNIHLGTQKHMDWLGTLEKPTDKSEKKQKIREILREQIKVKDSEIKTLKDDNGRLTRSTSKLRKEKRKFQSTVLECFEHVESKIAQAFTLLEEANSSMRETKDIVLKTNPISRITVLIHDGCLLYTSDAADE